VLPTSNKAITICPLNTGVRYAKILLIKWVRWVICKTTDSHTQFHTGRRFTPHKHDHNGQDREKKGRRDETATKKKKKKKTKMIVCKNTKGTFTFTRNDHYGTR
jgi:phosphate-selective porin